MGNKWETFFRPISRRISKTLRDMAILQWQTNRSSYVISRMVPFSMTLNNSLTQISRSRQYSTLNMLLTVGLQDRYIFRPTMDNLI